MPRKAVSGALAGRSTRSVATTEHPQHVRRYEFVFDGTQSGRTVKSLTVVNQFSRSGAATFEPRSPAAQRPIRCTAVANTGIPIPSRLGQAMYDLPYHKATDESHLREFIRQHPFAFLTGCNAQGRPVATQLPIFFEERDGRQFLSGHLMKNTDHHTAFEANPYVLAVFTSPHAYVSGSWYSNPHTPSTWNYMSVHARGAIRFLGGRDLERVLRKTSLHFEGHDESSPTTFDNLPASLTERLVRAIAAFEIEVESLDSVFKLSQDRDAESYQRIIERLRRNGDASRFIASEMERRENDLFQKNKEE